MDRHQLALNDPVDLGVAWAQLGGPEAVLLLLPQAEAKAIAWSISAALNGWSRCSTTRRNMASGCACISS